MIRIPIAIFLLPCILLTTAAYSDSGEVDRYFDFASALNDRGAQIGALMTRYKAALQTPAPEHVRADLALIWSISETASACSILLGNVIGATGMMDKENRESFRQMLDGSIKVCDRLAREK